MAGKRSSGEGTVRQMKSGNWRGQLMDGYSDMGKRNIVSFTAATKNEVVRKMREYQTQKESNIHIDRNISFMEWAEQWYKDFEGQVQPSTYCNYRYTLNILNRFLGTKKIAEILPMQINEFIKTISSVYSVSQITKCRAMLIQIFDSADANGLISRNAARYSRNLKASADNAWQEKTEKETKKDAFTDSEIICLMENLKNDMTGNSIRLILGTGLRVQELLALTKDDIAEDGSTLNVCKAVKTVNGVSTLGPPKSKRGNRIVPVPEEYRAYAVYLREHGREPFIWTSSWKNPLFGVKAFRTKYGRALAKIPDVRKLTPHCCRHTYITRLQAKGVPMETIARLVGHSKIQTTDAYLHTSLETLNSAVFVLNGFANKVND